MMNASFINRSVPNGIATRLGAGLLSFMPAFFSLSPIAMSRSSVGYRIGFFFFFSAASLSLSSLALSAFSCASRSFRSEHRKNP